MNKITKLSLIATGAIMALVLVLGATAVFAQSDGEGDDTAPEAENTVPESQTTDPETGLAQPGFRGHHGMFDGFGLPEGLSDKDELLAAALGIDVETLEAARETARTAAIEQALAEELITEEQAEMLLEGDFGFHRGPGFHGFGGSVDHEALLAEALDISAEELQAAKQQAHEAALAEMVDAGYLTEEEAELVAARQALREAIDRQALLAEVLNLSEADLEEALANRQALATLIEESGMTIDEFREAMQAAYDAAVEQAIQDGVITAEQYEALQDAGFGSFGLGGPGIGGHGRGGHGRHGGFGGFVGPAGVSNFPGLGAPSTATTAANSI